MPDIDPNSTPADGAISEAEALLEETVQVGAVVASPYLHSAKATAALSQALQLSPIAIHLGFLLAHLFHHAANNGGLALPVAPVVAAGASQVSAPK